jgi:hypothetical protein
MGPFCRPQFCPVRHRWASLLLTSHQDHLPPGQGRPSGPDDGIGTWRRLEAANEMAMTDTGEQPCHLPNDLAVSTLPPGD